MSYKEQQQSHVAEQIAVRNLRRELLTRSIPEEGQVLARTEPFFRSLQPFSHQFGVALTTEPIFSDTKRTLRPTVDISAALADAFLTPLGRKLKSQVAGRDFIDLGCGNPEISKVPRLVADAFGASRYIGVDKHSVSDVVVSSDAKIPTYYLNEDMLAFVSQLSDKGNYVFYLGGIEPVYSLDPTAVSSATVRLIEKDKEARAYTSACLSQIATVTRPRDMVIIGQGTHRFDPGRYGFELTEKVTRLVHGEYYHNIASFYQKIKPLY